MKKANERKPVGPPVDYEKIIQDSNAILLLETKLMAI
jgi:hypothetical protein